MTPTLKGRGYIDDKVEATGDGQRSGLHWWEGRGYIAGKGRGYR